MATLRVAPVGQWALEQLGYGRELLRALSGALAAALSNEGGALVRRTTLYQIYFTGVDAVWVVAPLAAIIGGVIIAQTLTVLSGATAAVVLGKTIELVLIRELGPMMTAVIVIGRSGSAIAAELANMKVLGEIDLLESMGIDIYRLLVLPRLVGVTSAIFCLCLVFDVVAVLGGYAAASVAIDTPLGAFLEIVGGHLTVMDIATTGLKALAYGLAIATISCWQGLSVQGSTTEVPQATRRAVVHSLVVCIVADGIVSALFLYTGW